MYYEMDSEAHRIYILCKAKAVMAQLVMELPQSLPCLRRNTPLIAAGNLRTVDVKQYMESDDTPR